jgi:hypothetical protein
MSFIDMLSLWFDPKARSSKQLACSLFDREHTNLKRIGCQSLRREGDSIVVAIFYTTGLPSRPEPYKIYVANAHRGTAVEVDVLSNPDYEIRGRK